MSSSDTGELMAAKDRELALMREMLAEVRAQRGDAMEQRDKAMELADRHTRLLTHQGEQKAPPGPRLRLLGWFCADQGTADLQPHLKPRDGPISRPDRSRSHTACSASALGVPARLLGKGLLLTGELPASFLLLSVAIDSDIDSGCLGGGKTNMATQQLLIRLPEELARRLKRRVPARGRSAFVQALLEQALPPDEGEDDPLYRAALAVEEDEQLADEMAEWDAVAGDGLAAEASAAPRE